MNKLICILLLLGILSPKRCTDRVNKTEEDNTSPYVLIHLNSPKDGYQGIPIESKTEYVNFYLPQKDSLVLKITEGTITVFPANERVFRIRVQQATEILTGYFQLAEVQHVQFTGKINPEDYSTVIHPKYYYIPYRVGMWQFPDGEVVECKDTFSPIPEKLESDSPYILLYFNAPKDGYQDIPIKSETRYIRCHLPEKDSLVLNIAEGSITLFPLNDAIFKIRSEQDKQVLKGYFKLPEVQKVQFIGKADMENYTTEIHPQYFYAPYRVGKWQFPDGEIMECKNSFDPTPVKPKR